MSGKVIFYIIVTIILFLLTTGAYSYSTFDIEKQKQAEYQNLYLKIIPEYTILSLEQGSLSIQKLQINLQTNYNTTLKYSFEGDLPLSIDLVQYSTKYSHYKYLNIKVPENAKLGNYILKMTVVASNGFVEKSQEIKFNVDVTEMHKYSINSNSNTSLPNPSKVYWDYTLLAIGKNFPSEKVNIKVKNFGSDSDFFLTFKNNESCFVVNTIPAIINIKSNETKDFVFSVDYNAEVNSCKDSTVGVYLRDSHTNIEYFLGNELVLFRDDYEYTVGPITKTNQTTVSDTGSTLTPLNNQGYNKDSNTVLPVTGSTSTSLNSKPTALFAMENRAITIGAIILIALIFLVIIFRGGFMNNTKSIKKLVKEMQSK